MKIVVVGMGYVGLSNSMLLAQHNNVIGVDISQELVNALNERKSPILDNEIIEYLAKEDLNFHATTNLPDSVIGADYVIVSTPTNYDENINFFDTSSVESVIEEVIKYKPNSCIIIKSTVPVGFTDKINDRLGSKAVVFSPEFLREGRALLDNLYPERIIVGEMSERAEIFAHLLLQGALKETVDFLFTGSCEAEAIKLFSNTYLAMRVSFFNELDSYALSKGLNSRQLIEGVCLDTRIGNIYNNPSFGYGGYCLPKDTKQLLADYGEVLQNLMQAVVSSNETRMDFIADTILMQNPKTVGFYRLIMKEGSDNFRLSAVQGIMQRIKSMSINVVVYEPYLKASNFCGFQVIKSLDQFKSSVDVIAANRYSNELSDVENKLFTRDLFQNN